MAKVEYFTKSIPAIFELVHFSLGPYKRKPLGDRREADPENRRPEYPSLSVETIVSPV